MLKIMSNFHVTDASQVRFHLPVQTNIVNEQFTYSTTNKQATKNKEITTWD